MMRHAVGLKKQKSMGTGATLLLFVLLGLLCGAVQSAQPKGVFETCPACRLSAMPELKRFLSEAVLRKEYGDNLAVKYIFGKTPTLILYDETGKEISATEVDPKLDYNGIHKWVQSLGFVRQDTIGLPAVLRAGAKKAAAKASAATEAAAATAAKADNAAQGLLPAVAPDGAAATGVALGPPPAPAAAVVAAATPAAAAAGAVTAAAAAVQQATAATQPESAGAGVAAATTQEAAAAANREPAGAGVAAATAPTPAEPSAKEAQLLQQQRQQVQQRRRHRRRRMRQRPGAPGVAGHRRRRPRQNNGVGPGTVAL